MDGEQIPQSWIGSTVEAVVMHGWLDEEDGKRGVTAWKHTMKLYQVNDLGLVATSKGSKETEPRFFPWTAILSMKIVEEGN